MVLGVQRFSGLAGEGFEMRRVLRVQAHGVIALGLWVIMTGVLTKTPVAKVMLMMLVRGWIGKCVQ